MTLRTDERRRLEDLDGRLRSLRADVDEEGRELFASWQGDIHRRSFCLSALNLAHYLALRRRDIRTLQFDLQPFGLSSLGRSESHVLANLDAVIASISGLLGSAAHFPRLTAFERGRRLLSRNTVRLFGGAPDGRRVRIMVTMPTEAGTDGGALIRELVARGMDCVRINAAHDNPEIWGAIARHAREAAASAGRTCRIHVDLGGPKPRTGALRLPDDGRLHQDDVLLLRRDPPDDALRETYPFQAECLLPEVIDQVTAGQPVWFDDGKIGAVVDEVVPAGLVLRITHARPKGEKLATEKGINFPETELKLSPLTPEDLTALDFAAREADLIGYSFVQSGDDVALLQDELRARCGPRDARDLVIVAKIETRRAVRNLPDIIVHAAGVQPFGVMIARGDLAVELGFERTAEMQEELLWLCEAAHAPVIWATQVLDRTVSKGTPSRSEMTDAAMASRAECVMLNKGDYVADAVTMLDDVLRRMQTHQTKKTPTLRALRSWAALVDEVLES